MARRGEVGLDDPVAKYLPDAQLPRRGGQEITLGDLVTHTSGLPFMPDPLPALDDPAGELYSAAELYKTLAHLKRGDAAPAWKYSTLGYWLLAQAMSARADLDYECCCGRGSWRRWR